MRIGGQNTWMKTPTWYNPAIFIALAGAGALIPQMGVPLCNANVQGCTILIFNPGPLIKPMMDVYKLNL